LRSRRTAIFTAGLQPTCIVPQESARFDISRRFLTRGGVAGCSRVVCCHLYGYFRHPPVRYTSDQSNQILRSHDFTLFAAILNYFQAISSTSVPRVCTR
jgi:hypothetical protein